MALQFNLIKELYLDVQNRDIVRTVLQYINRDNRNSIVKSLTENALCRNCFKQSDDLIGLVCYKYHGHVEDMYFCSDCTKEHGRLFTYCYRVSYQKWDKHSVGEYTIQFTHNCDFMIGYIICYCESDELIEGPEINSMVDRFNRKEFKSTMAPDIPIYYEAVSL